MSSAFDSDISLFYVSDMPKKGAAETPDFKTLARLFKIPAWGVFLLVGLGAVLFHSPFWQAVYPRLDTIDGRLSEMDKHLSNIDGSLKVLIPVMSKRGLQEALASADMSDAASAVASLESASALLSNAGPLKVPANPKFFETAVALLNNLDHSPVTAQIASDVHAARVALAEYRSALEPAPTISGPTRWLNSAVGPQYKLLCEGGSHIVWTGDSTSDMFIILPPSPPRLVTMEFDGCVIEKGQQTLDLAAWRNITFVNMKLFYKGGNMILDHVRFVNCTFAFVSNNHSRRVLDYAALNQSSLRVGLNFPPPITVGLNR
jgi:hypothetical protein